MTHKDKRVNVYLEELASASATPGGGSAAALAGAMGAGLVSMACRLTAGRRRFADVQDEVQEVLDDAEVLRVRLIDLADADSRAFDQVMAAYRLPNGTPTQQTARHTAIQSALQGATQVPLETARACRTLVKLTAKVIDKINPNARGDVGVAALLAEACLKGAQLNVTINLAGINDPIFVQQTNEDLHVIRSGIDGDKGRVFGLILEHD